MLLENKKGNHKFRFSLKAVTIKILQLNMVFYVFQVIGKI